MMDVSKNRGMKFKRSSDEKQWNLSPPSGRIVTNRDVFLVIKWFRNWEV